MSDEQAATPERASPEEKIASGELDRPLTGEEKILSVEQQIRACEAGAASAILCPYCHAINTEATALCCHLLGAAVLAIFERMRVTEQIDLANEIADKAAQSS